MNRIFRVIFNKARGTFVAVSELTKSQGKEKSESQGGSIRVVHFPLSTLCLSALIGVGISAPAKAWITESGNRIGTDNSWCNANETVVLSLKNGYGICNDGQGSVGTGAVVIGYSAKGKGEESTVVGYKSVVTGRQGTVLGGTAGASSQATAIGNDVFAYGMSSVAIGNDDLLGDDSGRAAYIQRFGDALPTETIKTIFSSVRNDTNFFASTADFDRKYIEKKNDEGQLVNQRIFSPTYAKGRGSIVVGSRSIAGGELSTSVGSLSFALADRSTAVGLRTFVAGPEVDLKEEIWVTENALNKTWSQLTDDNRKAFGNVQSNFDTLKAIILWEKDNPGKLDPRRGAQGGTAMGEQSRVFAANSVAVGNFTEASNTGSFAYGYSSKAVGPGSLAFGYNSIAGAKIQGNIYHKIQESLTNLHGSNFFDEFGRFQKPAAEAFAATVQGITQQVEGLIASDVMFDKEKKVYITVGGKDVRRTMVGASTAKEDALLDSTTVSEADKAKVERAENAMAIGRYSFALRNNSLAMGYATIADARSGLAIGSYSQASARGDNSVALGVNTFSDAENSFSGGYSARVYSKDSIALGVASQVGAILGRAQKTTENLKDSTPPEAVRQLLATGRYELITTAQANDPNFKTDLEKNTIIMEEVARIDPKTGAYVKDENGNLITDIEYRYNARNATAIGKIAKVTARDSMALGNLTLADRLNSVALGYHSKTDYTDDDFAMEAWAAKGAVSIPTSSKAGIVSVGQKGQERRITNVASGALDTDAVNVSQLRTIDEKFELAIAGLMNGGGTKFQSLEKNSVTSQSGRINAALTLSSDYKSYVSLKKEQLKLLARHHLNGENFSQEGMDKIQKRLNVLNGLAEDADVTAVGRFDGQDLAQELKQIENELRAITPGTNEDGFKNMNQRIDEKFQVVSTKQPNTGIADLAKEERESNIHNDGAKGDDSIALGYAAKTSATVHDSTNPQQVTAAGGKRGVAIGYKANVQAEEGVALGAETTASGKQSIAMGQGSSASAEQSIVIGQGNTVTVSGKQSIAVGQGSTVSGLQSIAIGTGHTVAGNNSGTFGDPNVINYSNSYAVGNNNTIGSGEAADDTKAGSFVLGNNVNVTADKVFVLGSGTGVKTETEDNRLQANLEGSVYLGYGSAQVTAAASRVLGNAYQPELWGKTYDGTTGDNKTIAFAGNNPTSIVTIGSDTVSRLLQGVAAGTISATSTDAINGSQLFAIVSSLRDDITTATQNAGVNWFNVNSKREEGVDDTTRDNNNKTATVTGALGADSIAIGKNATAGAVGKDNAVAIGLSAKATEASSVAIGSNSEAGSVHGDGPWAIDGGSAAALVVQDTANTADQSYKERSVFAVGSAGKERQIQHVAAGVVSATSTDAINGSQLFATNKYLTDLAERAGLDGKPINGIDGAKGQDGADGTTIAGADGAKGDAGRDGIPGGSGIDGANGADGTPGLAGPAGRDGQSDTTLANKVQSLRDGVSGTVVYTDAAGNRVLAENGQYYKTDLVAGKAKHTDGLWYAKDSFNADGTLKTEAKGTGKSLAQLDQAAIDAAVAALGEGADETAKANAKKTATKTIASNDVILSAVNPDGKTATPVTLGNIASVLGIDATGTTGDLALNNAPIDLTKAQKAIGSPSGKTAAEKGLFGLSGANLNRAVTAADLQALAVAGLNFGDRSGEVVNIPLGGQFNIYGDGLLDKGANDKYVTTATTTNGVNISLTKTVTDKLDKLPEDTKGTIDAIALNIAGDKSSTGKITLKGGTLAITGNSDLETAASDNGVTLTLQKATSVNAGGEKAVTSGAAFTAITGAKTKVELASGSDGALKLDKTKESTDLEGNVYTLSLDKSQLATNLGDTFAKKNASNLEDADVTAWKSKLGITGMASSGAGITFKGNGADSQDAKVKLDSTLNIEGAADEIVAVTSGGGTEVGKLSLSLAQAVKDKLGKIPATGDLVTTVRKITLKAGGTSTNDQTLASDVAFNIDGSDGVTTSARDSTVSVKITDAGVTAAKLAKDAVTTEKIKDGNVTKAKLADGSVDSSKIVDGSVAETDLTSDLQTKLGGIDAWKNATIQLAGDNNTATKAVKLSETPIKFTIKGNDDIVTTAAQDGTLLLALQKATAIANSGENAARVVTSSLVYNAIAKAKPTVQAAVAAADDNNLIKVNGSKSTGIDGDTFSVSLSENDLVTTLNNYYVNKTNGGGITFLDNQYEVLADGTVPKVVSYGDVQYHIYEQEGIRYYRKVGDAQDSQFYVRKPGGELVAAQNQDPSGKIQLMNTAYGEAKPQSQTIALGNKLQFVGDGYITVEYDQASYRDGEAPRLKVKVTDAVLDALEDLKVGDFAGTSSISYKANATSLQKVTLLQGFDFRGESTASSANKNINVSLGTGELANKGVVNFSLNENLQGIQSIGSGLRANTDDTSEARLTFHSADTSTTPAKAAYIEANNVKLTGLADGEVKSGSKDAITGGQLSKFLGINDTEHGSIGDRITNLENGLKGTVVYTDKDGNRLVKTSDGKYYKVADTLDKGYHFYNNQWYSDADWDDDKGTPLSDSVTAQTVAEFTASESNPVMLSLVDSQNQTTSPITLANLASALGLATKVGTVALGNKDTAQTTVTTLLGKKGVDLGRAATVADLQALALAGIDFVGNQDADANSKANRIRASIGSLVKIEGKKEAIYGTDGYATTDYSANNLITHKDAESSALRIEMKTKPSFEALTLQPSGAGALPVTLTPSKTTDGQPTLALSSGSGSTAQPVVLNGVAAGTDGKDAVNMDQLNAVKNAIGMNGSGTAGSQGPAGQDGLDGQSLSNQVKALRDGLAGTVVYTDKQGTRLLSDDGQYYYKEKLIDGKKKAIDGKWYAAANVNDDGTVKDSAKNTGKTLAELNATYVQAHPNDTQFVQTSEVILSAVDPSGETAAKPITLANLLGALNNPASSTVTSVDKVKALLAGKDPETADTDADEDALPDGDLNLSRVATAADLKVLAEAGLSFQGDDGELVARKLSETLKVTGDSTDYSKFSGAAGNIAVKKNSAGDGLLIQLAKDLANIESIGSGAKGDAYAARITFTAGKAAVADPDEEGPQQAQPAVDPTISMNSAKVTDVLAGDVSASSKDAVNGSQLYSVQSALGAGFEWKDGKLVGDDIAGTGKNNIVEAMQALQSTASNAAGGFSVAGDSTTGEAADKVAPGDTLSIKGVANSGIATTMDKARDALTISINNKTKFGAHAGIEAITGTSSQLVQEKAVKNYVDGLAEKFGSGMSVNGIDGFDGATGKPGTPGQRGVPGIPGKDGQGNTLVGPAGQDGLNGTTIVNKVQSLRDGVAGTMVYTDTNGKRVLAENGKYYDTSVVGDKVKASDGKWYDADKVNAADGTLKDANDKTGQTLAQLNAASIAGGKGDKSLTDDKVILSAVNPDGKTTSPVTIANLKDNLAGVTPTEAEVNQALSDLGLNPADVTDAQKASVKSKLAGKKASEEVAKLLGIDGSTEAGKAQLSRAVTLHDLQTVAQSGLTFMGNDGSAIHRALGTTLNIKGSNVVYTKSTLDSNGQPTATNIGNSHLYAADNLITHADGDDTVRIEMKKLPHFEGIVINGKDGDNGQDGGKGNDGFIGVDENGNIVVINGVDGKNGKNGEKGLDGQDGSRVITAADIDGTSGSNGVSVNLAYSANGKGVTQAVDENNKPVVDAEGKPVYVDKENVALSKGLNFNNGANTTASIDANGNVQYDLNKDLSGITSISSGKAKDDSGNDKDNSVEAKITLTPGEKGQDKDGKDVITKAPTVDVGGSRITNVADPIDNQDVANKGYVDGAVTNVSNNVTNITNQLGNLPLSYIKTVKEDGKDVVKRLVAGQDGQLYFADKDGKALMTDVKGNKLAPQIPDGIMLVQPSAKDTVDTAKAQTLGNVADGEISATSKEAINGSQIHHLIGQDAVKNGQVSNIGGTGRDTVDGAIRVVDGKATAAVEKADNAVKTANDAKNTADNAKNTAEEAKAIAKKATVTRVKAKEGSKNVTVTAGTDTDGASLYTVEVNDNPEFKQITLGGNVTMNTSVDRDGVSVLNVGSEETPTRIRGVADGVVDTDAANIRQLRSVDNKVNTLANQVNKVSKENRAGVASAMAMANLPQAVEAGSGMFSMAAGSFNSENAMAFGVSKRSDNGKIIFKASGTMNSQGDVGVGVGVGFRW